MKKFIIFILSILFIKILLVSSVEAKEKYEEKKEIIVTPSDRTFFAKIKNRKIILKIDADFIDGMIINNSLAKKLDIQPSLIGGGVVIGQDILDAPSRALPVSLFGRAAKKTRVHWFDRDIAATADGMISVNRIPYTHVTFKNRSAEVSDHSASLPMARRGTWGFAGGYGKMSLNGAELRVGLSYDRPTTIVSSAVGELLLKFYGGRFIGTTDTLHIRYLVNKPMRVMRLSTPLRVASLTVDSVYVQLSETTDRVTANETELKDEDEIVVTANKNIKRGPMTISLGTDDLNKCASVTFENITERITFVCRSS